MRQISIRIESLNLKRTHLRVGRTPERCAGQPSQRLTLHYHGCLTENGRGVDGVFDVGFILHADAISAEMIGRPVVQRSVPVVDGAFSVVVNFTDVAVMKGLWVAVGVRASCGPRDALRIFPREPIEPGAAAHVSPDSTQFSL